MQDHNLRLVGTERKGGERGVVYVFETPESLYIGVPLSRRSYFGIPCDSPMDAERQLALFIQNGFTHAYNGVPEGLKNAQDIHPQKRPATIDLASLGFVTHLVA